MKFFLVISNWAVILPIMLVLSACAIDEVTTTDRGPRIHQRSLESMTYYEDHNDFVLWLFESHLDSTMIYAEDPTAFMDFISRKNYEYEGSQGTYINNVSIVIDGGELIFEAPYYVKHEGFTLESGNYTSAEYDTLYSILDSVSFAFSNYYSESAIQDIIDRGKNRVIAMSFVHENELVNTLTQASFSMSLAFDLDNEMGGGFGLYINPCLLAGAMADVAAYQFFSGEGDLNDPNMEPIAKEFIRGVSAYSFANCYCSCP